MHGKQTWSPYNSRMTHQIRFFVTLILMFAFNTTSQAAERFKYSELQIKDYDEMQIMVKARLKKSQKLFKESDPDAAEEAAPDQGAVEELRTALLLILSRPNQDNMLAKLMPDVRKELSNVNAFEDSLSSLTAEAIGGLNNEKLPTVIRSTFLFVLENIISEFKPEARDKEEIRKVFEKIRDAKLKIPKDVRKDLKLRSMLKVESPSARAKHILENLDPKNKSR